MCGPLVVRRVFGHRSVAGNNEVAGFMYATMGVTYAVLLGFTAVVVWERFSDAGETTIKEGAAIVATYRLASGFEPAAAKALDDSLSTYVHSVIDEDWPAMASGELSQAATAKLTAVFAAAIAIPAASPRDAVLMQEVLAQLDTITEARRSRLELADGIVPNVIWVVLVAGALIVLGFTFFFSAPNVWVQALMTAFLALLIFLTLYVAMVIDHPFSGAVSVSPELFARVLREFGGSG